MPRNSEVYRIINQMFTPLVCIDKGIRKLQFEAGI